MHLICITFVFHFSWVLQPSKEKLKTILMQNSWGQIRFIVRDVQVAYEASVVLLSLCQYLVP